MSHIHSSSTKPEIGLRHELWNQGFRYRKNDSRLPGKPDIVLPKYHTVIFVHGCFWHGHSGCKKYVIPHTNTEFWIDKVSRNQKRDQEVWRRLEALGWSVIIVWECQLENKALNKTISRVESEILSNGDLYRRHKEERKLLREQRIIECRKKKERVKALNAEVKYTFHDNLSQK